MGQKYKLYGSKAPIWWSKMSEDRPAKAYFQAFPFNWELFDGYQVDWVSQFSGNVVIKDGEYTYFKQENTATGEITYWFVDDKSKQLTNGSVYVLGLDIWATYNMDIYDDIPETYNIGVERCHLIFDDYLKYNSYCLIDEMLDFGYFGDKGHEVGRLLPYHSQTGSANYDFVAAIPYWKDKVGGLTEVKKYACDTGGFSQRTGPSCMAYVFANWNIDDTNPGKIATYGEQYLVMPVFMARGRFYATDWQLATREDSNGILSGFDADKILGNTEYRLQKLIKQHPNYFIGTFILPPVGNTMYLLEDTLQDGGKFVYYYYMPIGFSGWTTSGINTRFFNTKWKYNEPLTGGVPDINPYGFVNSNRTFNGNPITPHKYFRPDYLDINGKIVFGNGFKLIPNNKDIVAVSGQLPANKEAYAAYYKGIEQSMNTAIKVSRDNAILGGFKSLAGVGVGAGQAVLGAATGDPVGAMKGVSNAATGIFNFAANILNHQHTKATFEAQLADAKNSIQPAIMQSADQDMRTMTILNGVRGTMLIKSFTQSGAVFNNNMAFLFGVKVDNWVPKKALNDVAVKNPCFYIEMQPAFLKTNFTQYISKKYPKMNMKLKSVILDAWSKGYRIWKEECDLSKEYTYDIGRA